MTTTHAPKRTAIGILFYVSIVVAGLTWIIPAGHYDYKTAETGQIIQSEDVDAYEGGERLLPIPDTYQTQPRTPQGLWSLLESYVLGFIDAVDIVLYVIIIGGYLGLIMHTKTLDAVLSRTVHAFRGREVWLIPITMLFFALNGSMYGMAEESIAYYPIVMAALMGAGFDPITAGVVILLGAGVGVMTSTVNPFATVIASNFAGISIAEGLVMRVIMFIVMVTASSAYVMWYGLRVKKNPALSIMSEDEIKASKAMHQPSDNAGEHIPLTGRRKLVFLIFIGSIAMMVYAFLPLSDFGITALPTLGWGFTQLCTLFIFTSLLVAACYGFSEAQMVKHFINGSKDILPVSLIIALARGLTVLMREGRITDTILHGAEVLVANVSDYLFVYLAFFVEVMLSYLVPSTSGLATLTMPILAPLSDFAGVPKHLIVTAYQSASGWVNLMTPTSAVVMGGLAVAGIPFTKYLRFAAPLFAILAVLILTMLSIGLAIYG